MPSKEEVLGSFSKRAVEGQAPEKQAPEKQEEGEPPDDDGLPWDGKRPYAAFKAVDRRQLRLRIRPAAPPWDQVKYQYLLHMPEDDHGTFLCLVFTVLIVVIKGKNLQPVSSAIGRESCSIIWAFNPAKFDRPEDPNAPFIESIDIRLETRGEVLEQAMSEIAAKG